MPYLETGTNILDLSSFRYISWDDIAFVRVRRWSSRPMVTNGRRPFGMRTSDLLVAWDRRPTTTGSLCYKISATMWIRCERWKSLRPNRCLFLPNRRVKLLGSAAADAAIARRANRRKVKYCRENPQNALLTTDSGFTIRSRAKEDKERERERERGERERIDRGRERERPHPTKAQTTAVPPLSSLH